MTDIAVSVCGLYVDDNTEVSRLSYPGRQLSPQDTRNTGISSKPYR